MSTPDPVVASASAPAPEHPTTPTTPAPAVPPPDAPPPAAPASAPGQGVLPAPVSPPPAPASAPASASPPPSPPARGTPWLGALAGALLVLALALVVLAAVRAGVLGGPAARPSVLHAMVSVMPTQACIPVTAEQIVARRFSMGSTRIDLNDVRDSLLFHMQDGNMSFVCGQYLQFNKLCYCIIDFAEADAPRRELVHMFNLDLLGGSASELVRNTEEVPFCAETHQRTRFSSVVYSYYDQAGRQFHARADGLPAQLVQMANDVQLAQAICADTNLEAMLQHIRRDIYELRSSADTRALDYLPPPRHAPPTKHHALPPGRAHDEGG